MMLTTRGSGAPFASADVISFFATGVFSLSVI